MVGKEEAAWAIVRRRRRRGRTDCATPCHGHAVLFLTGVMIVVNVRQDGDKECLGVCHVQGYVGMVLLLVVRNVIQVQDVVLIIVDVLLDGILVHH